MHTAALPDGRIRVALLGASFREQSTFADALAELLGPIENPRYLVTRRGATRGKRWLRRLRGRMDLHAVPGILGRNREHAEVFLAGWRRRLGPAELLYTRNAEGRLLLLRARLRSFAGALAPPCERLDRWH